MDGRFPGFEIRGWLGACVEGAVFTWCAWTLELRFALLSRRFISGEVLSG